MLEFDGQKRITPEEILKNFNKKISIEEACENVKSFEKYTMIRINDLFI